MRMRKKSRQTLVMPEIVLTPLIDVALTLVVILMVVSPVIRNGIKIDLPEGKSMEVSAQQEIVITVNRKGSFFVNSFEVDRADLVSEIISLRGDQTGMPVYIHADKIVSCGTVVTLLDDLKMAGVSMVGMSTRAIANAAEGDENSSY
ncbi:biopolymer transporter ExbD [Candidatus Babeliales bacterium]|nr:biopolymer transporter ExbD [Candidatus Babeliales bacterium]